MDELEIEAKKAEEEKKKKKDQSTLTSKVAFKIY
jgi:hypothetical protein